MKQLVINDPYGLVFVFPTSYGNIYDHLVGRVWKRSLQRCGSKPCRLYAQRHSFLSHALAMGTHQLNGSASRAFHQDAAGNLCQTHRQIEDADLADSLKEKSKKRCYELSYKSGCVRA